MSAHERLIERAIALSIEEGRKVYIYAIRGFGGWWKWNATLDPEQMDYRRWNKHE